MVGINPFAALEKIRGKVPEENKKRPKTKRGRERSNYSKVPTDARPPLQVLILDDLEITTAGSNQAVYKNLFALQDELAALLQTKKLDQRLNDIESLISEEEKKRYDSRKKTDFEKILGQISRHPRNRRENWTDNDHRIAVEKELLKLEDQRIRIVLEQSAEADKNWQYLYEDLNKRTELLACDIPTGDGENIKAIITAEYPWRIRVGGVQGFRERILPVLHPVYGIPYVPASGIKGLLRAWARKNDKPQQEIDYLLGFLRGKKASLAAVQILDAFPVGPSLSIDTATPQWEWKGEVVNYKPSPHQLMSLRNLTLNIGLTYTSCGNPENVKVVMKWLQQALLADSLGSRGSAGYGQANQVDELDLESQTFTQRTQYPFQFWSQGMYGSKPPSADNGNREEKEFRASAVRGIVRYWFRALALGFYSPATCRDLESRIFGAIEPKPIAGSVQIKVGINRDDIETLPHYATGTILIDSQKSQHRILLSKVLELAVHLGGVGRGSRRPLHWNYVRGTDGFRGVHWQLAPEYTLSYDSEQWQTFFTNSNNSIQELFQSIHRFDTPGAGNPGLPKKRQQDVINSDCQIYLIESPQLKHPKYIEDWRVEGLDTSTRGPALDLLYSSEDFKGTKKIGTSTVGNAKVGGGLGTPSYVVIQSNFPSTGNPYQAVTIFGSRDCDRQHFIKALRNECQGKIKRVK